MSDAPKDRRYTKTHEWALKEGDAVVVGLTDFAVHELSDLVFIDLPESGASVTAGEAFGEIESVKAVNDLLSPVSGEVVAVNADLGDSLEAIVDSPWDDGWMIKIKPSDPDEYESLMTNEDYKAQLEEGS